MLGGIGGKRRRGRQGMRCLDGITDSMDMSLSRRAPPGGQLLSLWFRSGSHRLGRPGGWLACVVVKSDDPHSQKCHLHGCSQSTVTPVCVFSVSFTLLGWEQSKIIPGLECFLPESDQILLSVEARCVWADFCTPPCLSPLLPFCSTCSYVCLS